MRNARGLSLIEVMLAIAIAAFALLCVYLLLGRAQTSAAINSEQRQLEVITGLVEGQFTALPSFNGLTTESITAQHPHGLRLAGGQLSSAFHGGIELSPATTLLADDSFDVTYTDLSTVQCTQLVPALMLRASNVLVDGQALQGSDGRLIGEDTLIEACAADAFEASQGAVTFRFHRPRATDAIAPVSSCTCGPQVELQSIACPAGQVGQIDQRRQGACTGGTPSCPSLEWQAWTTTNNTCAPSVGPPTVPPVVSPPAVTCIASTMTRTLPCTAPLAGLITEQMTTTCMGATPVPGPWVVVGSACVAPLVTGTPCTPHTETMPDACPSGQGGQITLQRSNTCASALGPQITGPWIEVSRTCTAACLVSGNCCAPERFDRTESRTCSAGQYGTLVVNQEMATTCASAKATPAPGAWVDVSVATNTCTGCPGNSSEPEYRWNRVDQPCPSGQVGSHVWEDEEIRTRPITYTCPAGTTTLPSATIGAWGAWMATGARRSEVNTCAAPPASGSCSTMVNFESHLLDANDPSLDPAGETYSCGNVATWETSCVAGDVCSVTSLPGSGGSGWNSWSAYDLICTGTCAPVATCTGSDTDNQWVSRTGSCPSGYNGAHSWEMQQVRNRACISGAWGAWGMWTDTTTTRNDVNTCAPVSGSNYTVISDSCASETHQNVPSLADQATALCNGTPGTSSTVHHFPAFQIGCYTEIQCAPAAPAGRWEWVMTNDNSGGCGAQGGGGGGTVCASSVDGSNGYGCGGQMCNAAHDGWVKAIGYAERLDAPWPACDYQEFTCMWVD